jgi:hypothetical protein
MTPNEILEIDAKRNHSPGTLAGHLRADINDDLRAGGEIFQFGDTLIVYKAVQPGIVEHHSFNADTPQNLVEANKKLWRLLKKAGSVMAYTTYQNPKINKLFEQAGDEFPVEITEDNGLFTAKVSL